MRIKDLSIIALLFTLDQAIAATGIVTLTTQGPNSSNEVQVAASQTVKLISGYDNCQNAEVLVDKDSKTFHYAAGSQFTIAGPATVRLTESPIAQGTCLGLITLDIEPASFPPDKTAVVGAYSGNVQVTMEMSTDLVNWTPAVNAMVYTNVPDARFFRIKL